MVKYRLTRDVTHIHPGMLAISILTLFMGIGTFAGMSVITDQFLMGVIGTLLSVLGLGFFVFNGTYKDTVTDIVDLERL